MELTDAQKAIREWYISLRDDSYPHEEAIEHILLRSPLDGIAWKILDDEAFSAHLEAIRFWGPLAKNDHLPSDEPLPRVMFLDDRGDDIEEAKVRRIRPNTYVLSDEYTESIATMKVIKEGKLYRLIEEWAPEPVDRVARLIEENYYLTDEYRNEQLPGEPWPSQLEGGV